MFGAMRWLDRSRGLGMPTSAFLAVAIGALHSLQRELELGCVCQSSDVEKQRRDHQMALSTRLRKCLEVGHCLLHHAH